ncbi:MAG: hypothetical protein V3U72_00140 [Candidatus Aenigmarchaeota archaeon]
MYFINMSKKQTGSILIIISILTVLTSSGCTFPGSGTTSGHGIVIENFEVDFPNVYANEKFKIQMKMRNTGSVDAYGVYAKLYNTEVSSAGEKLSIVCRQEQCAQDRLLAPDPERGTTGGSKICIWDCVAPQLRKGVSVVFNPSVRLYYAYETNVIKSLTITSQNELRNLQNQGKAPPSETLSSTTGPISMDVRVKGPIRYWEGETNIIFPVEVNINNVGGGTPCTSTLGGTSTECENPDNWNRVGLYFPEDISLRSCSGIENNQIVELWKSREKTVTCEAVIQLQGRATAGLVQKNIDFTSTYSYFTDTSTSVTVQGKDN